MTRDATLALEDTMATSTFDDLLVADLNHGNADAMRLVGRAEVSDVWSEISTWPAGRLRLALMAAVSGLDEVATSTPRR